MRGLLAVALCLGLAGCTGSTSHVEVEKVRLVGPISCPERATSTLFVHVALWNSGPDAARDIRVSFQGQYGTNLTGDPEEVPSLPVDSHHEFGPYSVTVDCRADGDYNVAVAVKPANGPKVRGYSPLTGCAPTC